MKNYIKEYGDRFKHKLRESVFDFAVKDKQIIERLRETVVGTSGQIDRDDYLYEPLGTRNTRDLTSWSYERAVQASLDIFEKNPFANSIIKMPTDALESAGLEIKADDDAVQAFINEWWSHPIFGYKNQFYKDFQDNKLVGESTFPFEVNVIDGEVMLSIVDPVNVSSVLKVPGNARIDDKVKMKPDEFSDGRLFDIVRKRDGVFDGNIYYFGFNKPTNGTRSRPELLTVLDWLDLFDQSMFSELQRWSLLSSFFIDVEVQGASPDEMDYYKKKNFPHGKAPSPGSVFVHNEKIKQTIMTPDLKANDKSDMAKLQRKQILSGTRMQPWMFGDPDGTNQGVARESARPTIWLMERDQRRVSTMIYTMLHFSLLQAQAAVKHTDVGVINESTNISFDIIHGRVFPKDLVLNAVAFTQLTASISQQISAGLISQENANKINSNMINELLDIEIDPDDLVDELMAPPEKENELEVDPITVNNLMVESYG